MKFRRKILSLFLGSIILLSCSFYSHPYAYAVRENETSEPEETELVIDERVIQILPGEMPMVEDVTGAAVSFDTDSVRIIKDIRYDLNVHLTASPSYDDVVWTSMDPSVMTVDDNGVLTGVSIGSAWIKAQLGYKQDWIYVYVDPNTMVDSEHEFEYYIKVNTALNFATIYKVDDHGEFSIRLRAFRCSTGPYTPIGTYRIKNHNLWNGLVGNSAGMWSSWFVSNYLFHSVPYYGRAHDSLKEYMYNELGETRSEGCVRLEVVNAKWICDNCPIGTRVTLYYDKNELYPTEIAEFAELPSGLGWDPTDPDDNNPWLHGVPSIDGVCDISVKAGDEVNYFDGVVGIDSVGNDITDTFKVYTPVDINTPGEYQVVYSLTDAAYKTVYAYCTVTVTA